MLGWQRARRVGPSHKVVGGPGRDGDERPNERRSRPYPRRRCVTRWTGVEDMNGSLIPAEGEREVMRSSAKLLERQVTSHLSASTGGVSVRPISGLTLRLGGWSGDRTAVEHELAPVD